MRGVSFVVLLLASCGVTMGRAPLGSLSPQPVVGASLEPGLAVSLRGAVARALARAGAASPTGAALSLRMREVEHRPLAAAAGERAEAWRAVVHVEGRVADRPGCEVAVVVEEPWSWSADPAALPARRARAVQRAAELAADRLIDALVAEPSCRLPR